MKLNSVLLTLLVCLPSKCEVLDEKCSDYEVEQAEKRVSFGESGTWQPNAIIRVYVAGRMCIVNVADIYAKVQLLKQSASLSCNEFFLELAFTSSELTEISFDTDTVNIYNISQYVVHIQLEQVTLSTDSLNKFARVAEIFSLSVADTSLTPTSTDSDCTFVESVIALSISSNGNYFNFNNSLIDFCRGHFAHVFTLTFMSSNNQTISHVPGSFISILPVEFPDLQQLVFEDVTVEENITFPWSKHYTALNPSCIKQIVPVAKLMNRRWFQLSQGENSLSSASHVEMNGALKTIVLNNLNRDIDRTILHNVYGLEKLDMTDNHIEFLWNDYLRYQYFLVELTLKNNGMFGIDGRAFSDLGILKYLDLSNNSLSFIPMKLFENLTRLEEIHLEENVFLSLRSDFLKYQLRTLHIVSLFSNPLDVIPALLLYAPNLRLLDLHNTSINGDSIIYLLNRRDEPSNVGSFLNYHRQPFVASDIVTKVVDLSHCKIRTILFTSTHSALVFQHLLKTLKFNFDGNPFYCACGILYLQAFTNMLLQMYPTQTPFSEDDMICQAPPELRGRTLLSVTHEEMYCPISDKKKLCPSPCFCSQRSFINTFIIDCSHMNVSSFPMDLPFEGNIELWFQNASIEEILPRNYFVNVTVLDLTNNIVRTFDNNASAMFENLHTLKIASNLLTTLPIYVRNITNLTTVALSNNPWLCDCRLGWMKSWLIDVRSRVKDLTQIKCTDGSNEGMKLIEVEDSNFRCIINDGVRSDSRINIVIPSVGIGACLVITIIVIWTVYFQRLVIKALLYVYCGFHPFDKDLEEGAAGVIDAVAIYCYDDYEFMHENVIHHLNTSGYNVIDMYEGFIIGVSFTENIKHFIRKSQRLIICFSNQTLDDELMKLAWSIAYEKVIDSCSNFIILVRNDIDLKKIEDKTVLRYFRNNRYVSKRSPVLQKCLRYLMPKPRDVSNKPVDLCQQQTEQRRPNIFICYPDNLHKYITQELLPCLRKHGYEVGIFEFEFVPGGAIGEEIVDVIEKSECLIFVLSQETLSDETKMLILKTSIVITLSGDYNFLLMCTHGKVSLEDMPSDVCSYVDTHVTSSIESPDFINRLMSALAWNKDAQKHSKPNTNENQ